MTGRAARRIVVAQLATVSLCVGLFTIAVAASYLQTFDGDPPTPLPFVLTQSFLDFDVQVHSRDEATLPMGRLSAEHGPDCGAPPATHLTSGDARDSVYQCNGHLMTALNEDGYGAIYLTPNHMVDFSGGGKVSFELSTERLSTRDWWDITVTPFADAQALPLLSDLSQGVDLQGPNRNSIVVSTDNFQANPNLKVVSNGAIAAYGSNGPMSFNAGIVAGTNQARTRQTFMLTLAPTHVRFERLASSTATPLVFIDQDIPSLSWTQGVIQFGHHSYNPTKDGAGSPATWHWDNFAIDPAVPFTILHFTDRATTGGTITALAPAPANAFLRFSAICRPVVNGAVPEKMTDTGHPEHFSSYLLPIAQGAQQFTVSFRRDDFYSGPCKMKDYAIWATGATVVPPLPNPVGSPPAPSGPVLAPAPASSFRSGWLDQSAYPVLQPSGVGQVVMHFRNSGDSTWYRGVPMQEARLGIVGDDTSFSDLGMNLNWVNPNRVAAQEEDVVPPGGVVTFRFSVRAPTTAGVYRLPLRPVIDGLTWLDDNGVYMIVTSDWGYHSRWASQSAYPVLHAGETSDELFVSFRNTGTGTWFRGSPSQINLGVVNDRTDWADLSEGWISPNRLATTREFAVAPGEIGTFVFRLRASGAPGTYVINLRPVDDGVTWLEDDGVWIQVTIVP